MACITSLVVAMLSQTYAVLQMADIFTFRLAISEIIGVIF